MDKPLVTIGVAVYNGAKYIVETLDSINDQTYSNIEIVIVDDGSSDDSFKFCNQWSVNSRFPIRVQKGGINLGLTKTCNVILNQANGKYLQLFDQDDIMLPEKIEHDVAVFEELNDKVALIYSKMKLIDENGKLMEQEYNERIGFDGVHPGDAFGHLIKNNFIPAPTVMLRTEYVKITGGYDESILFNDWDMWLKVARDFEISFTDVTNVRYRIHSQSMMAGRGIQQEIERNEIKIRMIKKHLGLSKKHDRIIFEKLKELYVYSYFLEDKNAKDYLDGYLKKKFDLKIWLYHKLAIAGIKHPSNFKIFLN